MAKKKKHRKTRKQKNAVKSNIATSSGSINKKVVKDSKSIKAKESQEKASNTREEISIKYFKHDVKRSLAILAAILVVFGILYILLDKTSIGTQVYSIINI